MLLAGLAAIVALCALPARAAAAPCPVNPGNATAWLGGSGSLGDPNNWSNGTPTGSCDVSITTAGSDVITMTGGANVRSLTLGGIGSTPQLVISDQSPNTNLDAQPAGIAIAAGASVILTCQPGGCPGGGPDIYSGSSPFANAGTITVDANTGGGSVVGGAIANTGTISFQKTASLSGQVVNKGSLLIADGAIVTNSGSSCGDTGASVKNDAGGLIDGGATGRLSVRNFEQGAGVSKDVTIPCGGTLNYSGSGSSEIRATGGFNLTGEMHAGQALTISAESSNTNASLLGDFESSGSIALTCPEGCGSSGAGFNVAGHQFTNAGEFTVDSDSGTGASIDSGSGGTVVNKGTMSFEQSAFLRGVTVNEGAIEIAAGKTVTAPAESCGNTGPRVVNGNGGSIDASGGGFLSVINYEQGNGTTSGTLPVRIPCGSLKYTGTGASTVQANASMTGNLAAGQTLRILGQVNTPAFANAGTIVFDQSTQDATLAGGTVTNTGRIEVSGPSANTAQVASGQINQTAAGAEVVVPAGTKLNPGGMLSLAAGTLRGGGTVSGTVGNSGGVVKPGDGGIGTLTVTGSYVQDVARLEIEIDGTGPGQHDVLAVGGVLGVNGTLALIPTGAFAGAAAIGDTVPFLTYGDFGLGGQFAQTTVDPALPCGKVFSSGVDEGAKALKATVVAGNPCATSGGGGVVQPPVVPTPTPKARTCPKGKKLKNGKCLRKKCAKGKKLKKGRCVKKKQPKARPRRIA
ncbi:MAG TPA: hypothetical protein VFN92_09140 [Solirubrobacterales bacterium]|nr:hypothetical protein [Solirubrobacterales bacterium]